MTKPDDKLIQKLQKTAADIRLRMVKMLNDSDTPGAHYGGSLSAIEILTTLYFHILNIDPAAPKSSERDRCILSKGHACAALCSVLAQRGYFSWEMLLTFNKLDSPFGVHPDMHKIPGCDMSAGSLGHGLPVGAGMALAARIQKKSYRTYIVLGDSEMAEGSCWEAIMSASHFKLSTLCAIIDRNHLSLDGPTKQTMSLEPLTQRIRSFGWEVTTCDGHNAAELVKAFQYANTTNDRPTMIIANTVKGKGVSFAENNYKWHYGHFDQQQYLQACQELNLALEKTGE